MYVMSSKLIACFLFISVAIMVVLTCIRRIKHNSHNYFKIKTKWWILYKITQTPILKNGTIVSCFLFISVAIMVVIVWKLDLHLPVQSVPITIKVVSSNPAHGEMYSIQQVTALNKNRLMHTSKLILFSTSSEKTVKNIFTWISNAQKFINLEKDLLRAIVVMIAW
jgi:hypothetical protein